MDHRRKGHALSRRTLVKGAAAGAAASAVFAPTFFVRRARAQQATVRLTGFISGGNAEQTVLEQQLATFAEQFPEITVEYEPIPAQYEVRLQADLAAGTAADVFYVDSVLAPDLMSSGVLLPLDDLMAAASVTAEDFYPNLIQAFQYNGQTFGLPKDWSALAMFYNTRIFEENGITTAPATWEEVRTVAQTLLDATGEPPVIVPPDFARYLAFHYQAGARILNEDRTEVVVDDPAIQEATQQALDFYYGLYRDGLATTPTDVGAQSADTAFGQESGAIVFEGNWVFGGFAQNFPDLQYAAAPMPQGPGGQATVAFTVSYSIFEGTEVPDAAWTLVNYLTGPEGMLQWTTEFGVMPSRPGIAEQWVAEFPERQLFVDAGAYAQPWQFGPGGQQFITDATAALQALFADDQSVEETATAFAEAAVENIEVSAPVATPAATPTAG